jgi:hypothetical protein
VLSLALCSIKVHVASAASILDRAAVCTNHQSNVDRRSCSTSSPPHAHRLQGGDQCDSAAGALRHGGFVPIERRNKEAAMRSLEAGALVRPATRS